MKDMEKEREGGKKTREMDHPVSECIMVGRGGGGGGGGEEADEQNWR